MDIDPKKYSQFEKELEASPCALFPRLVSSVPDTSYDIRPRGIVEAAGIAAAAANANRWQRVAPALVQPCPIKLQAAVSLLREAGLNFRLHMRYKINNADVTLAADVLKQHASGLDVYVVGSSRTIVTLTLDDYCNLYGIVSMYKE